MGSPATWQALGLRPGMEVAQLNWDGQNTHVDWVRVSRIDLDNGTPVVRLENYVAPGASGGGVFYAGHHIGNNWFRRADMQFSAGTSVKKWTFAALNETGLATLVAGNTESDWAWTAPLSTGNSLLNLAPTDVIVR